MGNGPVFISHATSDDAFVRELRLALAELHIPVWVDSRNLRGGNTLAPEIAQAIERARQVLVVLRPRTINSPWVRREIRQALQVQKNRQADGYRVIPLLLPGVETSALGLWFEEEPLTVPVQLTAAGLSAALPVPVSGPARRTGPPPLAKSIRPATCSDGLTDPHLTGQSQTGKCPYRLHRPPHQRPAIGRSRGEPGETGRTHCAYPANLSSLATGFATR